MYLTVTHCSEHYLQWILQTVPKKLLINPKRGRGGLVYLHAPPSHRWWLQAFHSLAALSPFQTTRVHWMCGAYTLVVMVTVGVTDPHCHHQAGGIDCLPAAAVGDQLLHSRPYHGDYDRVCWPVQGRHARNSFLSVEEILRLFYAVCSLCWSMVVSHNKDPSVQRLLLWIDCPLLAVEWCKYNTVFLSTKTTSLQGPGFPRTRVVPLYRGGPV